jgi:hypothetical protein
VNFIAARGHPIQVPAAHMVAAALAPPGIAVKIRLLQPAQVEAEEHAFRYGMRETYWTNDIADPDEYTAFTLCGSASKCERATIYRRVQQLAAHKVPMVWLGYSPFSYVYSPNVRGYHVETQGTRTSRTSGCQGDPAVAYQLDPSARASARLTSRT